MEPVTLETICTFSEDVVSREIQGELVIVPIGSGIGDLEDELYTLNDTGRAIWRRLDGHRTLAEVATGIAEEFDAPIETIRRDVLGFATELARRKILVCRG